MWSWVFVGKWKGWKGHYEKDLENLLQSVCVGLSVCEFKTKGIGEQNASNLKHPCPELLFIFIWIEYSQDLNYASSWSVILLLRLCVGAALPSCIIIIFRFASESWI